MEQWLRTQLADMFEMFARHPFKRSSIWFFTKWAVLECADNLNGAMVKNSTG